VLDAYPARLRPAALLAGALSQKNRDLSLAHDVRRQYFSHQQVKMLRYF